VQKVLFNLLSCSKICRLLLGPTLLLAVLHAQYQSPLCAKDIIVPPAGEYANINVKVSNDTIAALRGQNQQKQKQAIDSILASPDKFDPVVFYCLSKVLLDQEKYDDAAFWFYAGQLRARYDANRCADVSARDAVAVLNQQFGPAINKYTFHHLDLLKAVVPKVLEWDEKTPHNYDQRWINLHGMNAMLTSMDSQSASAKQKLSLPEKDWDKIAQQTRADYRKGFDEAIAQMEKTQPQPKQ
jgi:hypothetical protein